MVRAYYNEIDPFAAAWLRELIKAGLIAPGDVDERSIEDVNASDLAGYTQCHFFAGIGGWSYALRLAGWPDERPVWTGSCPCQPLSVAGQRKGHADRRHLWPTFHGLISECQPAVLFGEQVAGKDGREWFSAVRADLEAAGYACGAADLCAASVGAPHIRQRLYFVADSTHTNGRSGEPSEEAGTRTHAERRRGFTSGGTASLVAESNNSFRRADVAGRNFSNRHSTGRLQSDGEPGERREAGNLGHASGSRLPLGISNGRVQREAVGSPERQAVERAGDFDALGNAELPGTSRYREHGRHSETEEGIRRGFGDSRISGNFWSDAVWIYCRDEKYRPVEPGVEPLAHGVANRVGRLRGYGNAIVAPIAAEFIAAAQEAMGEIGVRSRWHRA